MDCDMSDPDVSRLHPHRDLDDSTSPAQSHEEADDDLTKFIESISFVILVNVVTDLPCDMEEAYEGTAVNWSTYSLKDKPKRQQIKESTLLMFNEHKELASCLLPNLDDTVEACLGWFYATESSHILDFILRCSRLLYRIHPAVLKRPALTKILIDRLRRFVESQVTALANGEELASTSLIESYIIGFPPQLWLFGGGLKMEEQKRYFGDAAVSYYRLLVRILDPFEPPNVFSSMSLPMLKNSDHRSNRAEIVDRLGFSLLSVWSLITYNSPHGDIDGLNQATLPSDDRVHDWRTASEVGSEKGQ
ncbi:hypothetical protein BDV98DRAFT_591392 [Pterulicium gracile]|uniref:Uncharacterized protein n=1 Tax=Pterulicium gracile TaxID=1884261 RepID=A0A5C3QPP1_9AGAR|nr:hypothetical protein BDV98DRAFT_591392 [Pterula gracilis]